jgi:ornithine decarboxylase
MKTLKVATTDEAAKHFKTVRKIVNARETDFVDVAAVVVMDTDTEIITKVNDTKFGVPIFVFTKNAVEIKVSLVDKVYGILDIYDKYDTVFYTHEIEAAATKYEDDVFPPFFGAIERYMKTGNIQFDTPGHQGGQYFRKHPSGNRLYEFLGENIFRTDTSSSDVALGDLLIHEGPPMEAEKFAARVFNADKTYFVLNGTTTSNAIAIGAILRKDDLVLFDRNNHKSCYISALERQGGLPVYLETSRDSYGFIGGIYSSAFEENNIRDQIAKIDVKRSKEKRPFRLAIIQLGTYDGTIYNAKQVVERIGHLCDYILFDSAWVGYEQFIPMMKDSSPLLLELGPDDPGILVTQSTHKQQAGFSQASQIHKKDSHIKGQDRYTNHKHFNSAYMQFSSTSPFYPIYATLGVNAKMQAGEAGKKLWHDLLVTTVNARKDLLNYAKMIRPFVPPMVNGKKWQEADTEEIVKNIDYWRFEPGAKWHGFDGYGKDQYFVDPNKFLLTTPGIDPVTNEYADFGVPANTLAYYLRENGIIPEKNDLNSILFLMTPAESDAKMANLVAKILQFEQLIEHDAPLYEVLPSIYNAHKDRYAGYSIRQLCQEIHNFYKSHDAKKYQKEIFLKKYFPEQTMTPIEATDAFFRNESKLVALSEIEGETALEGALPYPPGIFCVAPGEKWSHATTSYFRILEEGINKFPGFSPEIQGVYFENKGNKVQAFAYVYSKKVSSK